MFNAARFPCKQVRASCTGVVRPKLPGYARLQLFLQDPFQALTVLTPLCIQGSN